MGGIYQNIALHTASHWEQRRRYRCLIYAQMTLKDDEITHLNTHAQTAVDEHRAITGNAIWILLFPMNAHILLIPSRTTYSNSYQSRDIHFKEFSHYSVVYSNLLLNGLIIKQ